MNLTCVLTLLVVYLSALFASIRIGLISVSTVFRLFMFLLPIFICKSKKNLAILSVFILNICVFLNHAIICILSSKANEYYYVLKLECGLIDIGIVFSFFLLSVLSLSESQKKICSDANSITELKYRDKKELENYTYMIFISSIAFIISVLWDCNFQLFYKTVLLLIVGVVIGYTYYKNTIETAYLSAYRRIKRYRGDMVYDKWE